MIDTMLQGLALMLQPEALLYQFLGMILGLIFGAIPGLSGIQALAILIPFVFTMDANVAFSFLLGAHVATCFGGSITAILLNVPGTSLSIATCWDGHPMAKQGRAGEALGISAMSNVLGGWFGVIVLAISIPVMQPMIMALQPSELFMVALLGITLIVTLSAKSMIKGLVSGMLGLMISFIGQDPVTGVSRYTFGTVNLMDGIDLVAVVCGLYAVGEMIKLFADGGAVAKGEVVYGLEGVWKGMLQPFKHWFLLIRCSVIGALIGACPGVGGTVANVVAYGHAVQTSKNPETFGTGRPEGIIAPESSHISKEGGQMIPTLALGIPGGEATAVLLGAFLILGLQPGPAMITEHLDITFSIMWIIAFSSLMSSALGLLLAGQLARITSVPGHILAPLIVVFGVVGAFASHGSIIDVFVALGFGVIGYYMRLFGYSEACLIIGLVLGTIFERNFQMANMMYGPTFVFTRPISLVLLIATVIMLFLPFIKGKFGKGKEATGA
ncbi:MAG: tripartite tricarboxylate transporter permease [Firmicutes bacterium]|nr:tripartite tricarboxylate transporter permease [Bacillota bacterium]